MFHRNIQSPRKSIEPILRNAAPILSILFELGPRKVITLASPDLPLRFEEIAIRIL